MLATIANLTATGVPSSNPGQASTPYALQTTFPTKDLTDDSQTIKDANLLGSVVVQRGL